MCQRMFLSYIYGSGTLNSLMALYDTRNAKVLRLNNDFKEIKTDILFTEKIGIGLICFSLGPWQLVLRLIKKIKLAEIEYKGYDKTDYGIKEKKYISDYSSVF